MAITEFRFEETDVKDERTEIQLCAYRWELYGAIIKIDQLLISLFEKAGEEYIPIDFITANLTEALKEVRHLID